jgi:hypothetical protein
MAAGQHRAGSIASIFIYFGKTAVDLRARFFAA